MSPITLGKLEEGSYLVDMRGWMCPYPKYVLGPLFKRLPSGTRRVVLLVDCPSAAVDVPKEVLSSGLRMPEVTQIRDGEWQIAIELK